MGSDNGLPSQWALESLKHWSTLKLLRLPNQRLWSRSDAEQWQQSNHRFCQEGERVPRHEGQRTVMCAVCVRGSPMALVETIWPGQLQQKTHIQLLECFLKWMGNNGMNIAACYSPLTWNENTASHHCNTGTDADMLPYTHKGWHKTITTLKDNWAADNQTKQ